MPNSRLFTGVGTGACSTYIETKNGVSNIWGQPLNGGETGAADCV
ncbi:MAG: hypothetical protein WKF84_12105 [Pyrinomonadaceae bacterium]